MRRNLHTRKDFLPVGIFAPTRNIASSLVQELHIEKPFLISPKSFMAVRGHHLAAIVVEENLWPLQEEHKQHLLPCLSLSKGYFIHMERYDPRDRGCIPPEELRRRTSAQSQSAL